MKKIVLCMMMMVAARVVAVDGTWVSPNGGAWTESGKWLADDMADGVGATATFDIDFTQDITVTPGAAKRVIGHLVVSNQNTAATTRVLSIGSNNSTEHMVFDT